MIKICEYVASYFNYIFFRFIFNNSIRLGGKNESIPCSDSYHCQANDIAHRDRGSLDFRVASEYANWV